MKQILGQVLFFVLFISSVQGNNVTDSLTRKLGVIPIDGTEVIEILNELAWQYRNEDPYRAKEYGKRALQIAQLKNNPIGIGDACSRLGTVFKHLGQLDSALFYYKNSLHLKMELDDQAGVSSCYHNLAVVHQRQGEPGLAINYFQKALVSYEMMGDSSEIAGTYNGLGFLKLELGLWDEAYLNFQKGLDLRILLRDFPGLARSYLNMGSLFHRTGSYQRADSLYRLSLEIYEDLEDKRGMSKVANNLGNVCLQEKNYEEAEKWYRESIDLKLGLNSSVDLAGTYMNMGMLLIGRNHDEAGISYYLRSEALLDSLKDINGLIETYANLGKALVDLGDVSEGIDYLLRADSLCQSDEFSHLRAEVFQALSFVYLKQGEIELAFHYQNEYVNIRDSLVGVFKELTSLEREYQSEKQKRRLLEKERELKEAKFREQQAEWKRQQQFLIFLFSLFMIATISFFIVNTQKRKRLESEKKLQDQQIAYYQSIQEVLEKERKRIGNNIHDLLGAELNTAMACLKGVEERQRQITGKEFSNFNRGMELLKMVHSELRDISHILASAVFEKLGLEAAAREVVENIALVDGVEASFFSFGGVEQECNRQKRIVSSRKDRIDYELYAVLKAMVDNALQHAEANSIVLQLGLRGQILTLSIEDDGVGFEHESAKGDVGLGIRNAQLRIQSIGGEFYLDSSKGNGTTLLIEIDGYK